MANDPTPPENVSNRLPRTDSEAEHLKTAIAELLRTVPETWTEFDLDGLTRFENDALFLLLAAGMVERRGWLRSTIANHPTCFEVQFRATGERGFAKAMEHLLAAQYAMWGDAWRTWKAGETGQVSPFHIEAMKPQEWRLTDQGVIAIRDLDGTNRDTVFDFVFKRGTYGPGYWKRMRVLNRRMFVEHQRLIAAQAKATGKAWTELPRPPVGGDGLLITMRKTDRPAEPQAVNLTNWQEGAGAFAAALGKMLQPYFEAMGKAMQVNPPASGGCPPGMPEPRAPNGIAAAGPTRGKSHHGKAAKGKRGRPTDTDPKRDKRIYEAWKSGQYRTQADCDRELGLPSGTTYAACERHRKRLQRRNQHGRTK